MADLGLVEFTDALKTVWYKQRIWEIFLKNISVQKKKASEGYSKISIKASLDSYELAV